MMARVLTCPECDQVMHRVSEISERSVVAGCDQLARHCFTMHVLDRLEDMLTMAAEYGSVRHFGIEDYKEMLAVFCGGCHRRMSRDTPYYVQKNRRTLHCCSQACADALR